MKILVTGATGYIGRHLLPMLLEAGHELTVLVRNPGRLKDVAGAESVRVVPGDLQDEDTLALACADQDMIIHLAALAHITHTSERLHWQVGYQGTHALRNAAMAAEVPRFLFISSSKASGAREASPYARAKAAAEALLLSSDGAGTETCILRPAPVYGPGMRGNLATWIRHCMNGIAPPLPDRCASIYMVSLDTVCRQILRACQDNTLWGRRTWWLADAEPYHLKAVENAIRRQLGRSPVTWGVPVWCWWLAGAGGDLVHRLSGRSIGISLNSYRTLFHEDMPDPSVPRLSPQTPQKADLFEALPALIASIKKAQEAV